jgi:hypothetical protein
MVYRPPYPWFIDPGTHGILTPCPWNIDPTTYGISNPLLWYHELLSFGIYQTLSYGIMNSSLLVEMRRDSIYHEGVHNTMTKN